MIFKSISILILVAVFIGFNSPVITGENKEKTMTEN